MEKAYKIIKYLLTDADASKISNGLLADLARTLRLVEEKANIDSFKKMFLNDEEVISIIKSIDARIENLEENIKRREEELKELPIYRGSIEIEIYKNQLASFLELKRSILELDSTILSNRTQEKRYMENLNGFKNHIRHELLFDSISCDLDIKRFVFGLMDYDNNINHDELNRIIECIYNYNSSNKNSDIDDETRTFISHIITRDYKLFSIFMLNLLSKQEQLSIDNATLFDRTVEDNEVIMNACNEFSDRYDSIDSGLYLEGKFKRENEGRVVAWKKRHGLPCTYDGQVHGKSSIDKDASIFKRFIKHKRK